MRGVNYSKVPFLYEDVVASSEFESSFIDDLMSKMEARPRKNIIAQRLVKAFDKSEFEMSEKTINEPHYLEIMAECFN